MSSPHAHLQNRIFVDCLVGSEARGLDRAMKSSNATNSDEPSDCQPLPWVETIASDDNMIAFKKYVEHAPKAVTDRFKMLYTVEHRSCLPITGETVDFAGTKIQLPHQLCPTPESCVRCTSRRGGFKFHWDGPWTCSTAKGTPATTCRHTWRKCFYAQKCENCRELASIIEAAK